MSSHARRIACASMTMVLLLGSVPDAAASVDAASPSATIRMPPAGAGEAVTGGDFSIFAWIRPAAMPDSAANIYEIQNGIELQLLSDGSVRVTMRRGSPEPTSFTAVASATLQPNEWALLAASYAASNPASLEVWAVSESQPLVAGLAAAPGGTFTPGPLANNMIVGAWSAPAMIGRYGLIAVRNHTITSGDVLDVWNSRLHHAPHTMNTIADGGSMSGTPGTRWAVNHSMSTRPLDAGAAAPDPRDRAAVVGQPVTLYNWHVWDATGSAPDWWNVVRRVFVTQGFTYTSPHESPGDGFFLRQVPPVDDPLPSPPYVAAEAPNLRRLALGQPIAGAGVLRVMTSANSRAVEGTDGSYTGIGNYAAGFIGVNISAAAGVLNRPLRLAPSNEPWFGFDTGTDAPYMSGTITGARFTDFARFWTGCIHGGATGPGDGLILADGATHIMRCRPQGLIEATQPLIVQAHLLRYPGSSNVQWTANKHVRQGEPGTDVGSAQTVTLNTQTWSHIFNPGAGDQAPTSSRMILAGSHVSQLAVGDACYGDGAISLVASVSYDAGSDLTTIDFERPLASSPSAGSVLRFGPWGFETLTYEWPGLDAVDPNIWRGLKLTATGGAGQGVIAFSSSAWRPNVDGFAFGMAGWGGRGYTPQLNQSFSSAITAWMQLFEPHVWLQMFAQQQSAPSSMSDYAARIRQALPNIEIAWLGDGEHGSMGTSEAWHHYILEHAAKEGVVAASLLEHPRLGGQNDTWGDGLRSDALHLAQRGNETLAALWSELLLDAAIDPNEPQNPADLNGDGTVDVLDLLILLDAWGACKNCGDAGGCPADFNDDCSVDVLDLLFLLDHWG